jgi:hypothetical protein
VLAFFLLQVAVDVPQKDEDGQVGFDQQHATSLCVSHSSQYSADNRHVCGRHHMCTIELMARCHLQDSRVLSRDLKVLQGCTISVQADKVSCCATHWLQADTATSPSIDAFSSSTVNPAAHVLEHLLLLLRC